MAKMRAKVRVDSVLVTEYGETLKMHPVCKSTAYDADGKDEDNTFAKFSPSGEFSLTIANPELFGKFKPGQKLYVDFSDVPEATPSEQSDA